MRLSWNLYTYVLNVKSRTYRRVMTVSASQLRQNIYRLIDHVLETGEPLEIARKGRTLRLVADEPRSRFDIMRVNADLIVGDPEDLAELGWADSWNADAVAGL